MSGIHPRVAWRNGEVLLPAHFRALEDSLADEAAVRGQVGGLPAHGLIDLAWTGAQPVGGVVDVLRLRWITPGGAVVEVPGNARVENTLELSRQASPRVRVHLHLLREAGEESSTVDPVASEAVPYRRHRLLLSGESGLAESVAVIDLGEFTRGPSGAWTLVEGAVPPLLSAACGGYLTERLARLRTELGAFESAMEPQRFSPEMPPERRMALSRARIETRKLTALLGDVLEGGVGLHPYVLFRALRDFSLELEATETHRPQSLPLYRHEEQGVVFGRLLQTIAAQIRTPPPADPLLEFDREVGEGGETWLVRRQLTDQMLAAGELFLLVQKPSPERDVALAGATLAAPGRLRHTIEHRLTPVRLHPRPDDALARRFGAHVDVYSVEKASSPVEWRFVNAERALALFVRQLPADVQVFLHWRAATSFAVPSEVRR